MTLKEKFEQYSKQEVWEKKNYNAEECVEIAEDFAIGFAKWLRENDTQENAEKYFGYSDSDMLNEYKKYYENNH
jgi:hypothetical protein